MNVEECCASCGIVAGDDDIKLKMCTACKLVRYCSITCQKNHRPQHKNMCKKRAAEIREDKLFQQPDESHLGDCAICLLPLPLDHDRITIHSCCSKWTCDGCLMANDAHKKDDEIERCLYCREPVPTTLDESFNLTKKRIEANDPVALQQKGSHYKNDGDYINAFPFFTKAANLGNAEAHYQLSLMYRDAHGVQKDNGKEIYHLEEAAIYGHPWARHNLGARELSRGRFDRAKRHFIIAATLGYNTSMETLKDGYTRGFVGKDELAAALRANHAAVEETKSPQREAAAVLNRLG